MDALLKNIHWLIILYAGFNLFTLYEDSEQRKESAIQVLESIRVKRNKIKRKLSEINKFKANLEASKERVNEVVKQIEKIQKQLPSEVNDTLVQQQLGGYSNSLKIKDPKALPSKEVERGFYYEKEYQYKAQGTFLQFLVFFEKLTKSERILNVKKMNLTHINEDQSYRGRFQVLNLDATIESFRYNSNYKENNGLSEIETKYQ